MILTQWHRATSVFDPVVRRSCAASVSEAYAWRSAGFRIVGHLVLPQAVHLKGSLPAVSARAAFLLAIGNAALPEQPVSDVIDMPYSGNKLHPTQKPIPALKPLIESFTKTGDLVFDPFCGSGSTLLRTIMQPLPSGCKPMAFVRIADCIHRSSCRRQGRCRLPPLRR